MLTLVSDEWWRILMIVDLIGDAKDLQSDEFRGMNEYKKFFVPIGVF